MLILTNAMYVFSYRNCNSLEEAIENNVKEDSKLMLPLHWFEPGMFVGMEDRTALIISIFNNKVIEI